MPESAPRALEANWLDLQPWDGAREALQALAPHCRLAVVTNLGLGTLPSGYAGYLTNDTANNMVAVVLTSALHPQPVFKSFGIIGGTNLSASGVNGFANVPYHILSSTNVALPIANWTAAGTGIFGPTGSFSFTTTVSAATPQQFFLVRVP